MQSVWQRARVRPQRPIIPASQGADSRAPDRGHQVTWQRSHDSRTPDSTWPHGQWMAVSPLNFLFNGSLEVTTQSCPGKDSGVLVQTTDNRHITAHFIPHSWIKTRKGSGKTIISEARKLFQYKISIIHVSCISILNLICMFRQSENINVIFTTHKDSWIDFYRQSIRKFTNVTNWHFKLHYIAFKWRCLLVTENSVLINNPTSPQSPHSTGRWWRIIPFKSPLQNFPFILFWLRHLYTDCMEPPTLTGWNVTKNSEK